MGNGKDRKSRRGFRGASPADRFRPFSLRFALAVLTASSSVLLASCGNAEERSRLAERMAAEEGSAENDERIAELEARIRKVDAQVERTIEAVRDEATFWRLLGLKYMDYSMWGEALDAFDEAVAITPEHAALLYNRGLCAGQMALAADLPAEREAYVDRAETNYRRAIAVDPRYTPALYALAVLDVFERDDPAEAAALLGDLLAIERSDIPARFLLARANLQMGRPAEALDLYDEIIDLAKDGEDKAKAEELYARVAGGEYAR